MLHNYRLYLLVLGLAACFGQDCNNPLTSSENWPDDLADRPPYLSEPVDVSTVDLGLCGELIGDCSKTCCDENTIENIDFLVNKYMAHLAKKGEHFVGPILDTIGDFDPDVQLEIGAEYDTDGNPLGDIIGELVLDEEDTDYDNSTDYDDYSNSTDYDDYSNSTDYDTLTEYDNSTNSDSPAQYDNATNYDNSTDSSSAVDGQARGKPEFKGKGNGNGKNEGKDEENGQGNGQVNSHGPKGGKKVEHNATKSERDQNIKEQQEQMGEDRYRPKHRGKRRSRPGLLNLSEDQKAKVSTLVSDMVVFLAGFSGDMAKCLDSQVKLMAGMFCMGCNACYSDYVTSDSTTITVQLNQDSCDYIANNCSKYMDVVKELKNKFKEFKTSLKSILSQAIETGDIAEEDVHDEDLDEVVNEQATEACSGDSCQQYYCNDIFEQTGGLIPSDDITDPSGQAVIEVADDEERRMASSYTVKLEYGDSGYNPQNVDAVYSTQIDNYTSENAEEADDSSKYLLVSLLGLLAFL